MKKKWLKGLLFPLGALKNYHNYQVTGLQNIPKSGACIVACSHSFITYDILMLMSKIIEHYNRYPYCLVDTFLVRTYLQKKLLNNFGAIEASPENASKILESGNILFVAPGGMREFLKSHKDKHRVIWHDRKGFVRLAIDTQTPIVLAACPNADEIYHVHDVPLSEILYKAFKFPLVIASGFKGSPLPKKVILKHELSSLLYPPQRPDSAEEFDLCVDKFHAEILKKMDEMIKKAKN